jgi:hypothetical protein
MGRIKACHEIGMIMKKAIFAVMVAILSINALAAEDAPFEFKLISTSDSLYKDRDIKIISKDLKGGIFILVRGGWSTTYPKTAKLIGELMAKRGILVTDDLSKADSGIQFIAGNGFSYEDIESQVASGGLSAGQIGAILGGGVFGLIGVMSSSSVDKPVNALLMARVLDKPTLTGRNMDGENERLAATTVTYQTNKKGVETSNAIFEAYIASFIKNHFVFDNDAAPVNESAVSTTAIPVATNSDSN